MYRNIEFDCWNDIRKEAKRYNAYCNDYNFKVNSRTLPSVSSHTHAYTRFMSILRVSTSYISPPTPHSHTPHTSHFKRFHFCLMWNFLLSLYPSRCFVLFVFQVGAKCRVELEHELEMLTCHIQKISHDKASCLIFLEKLGKKILVPLCIIVIFFFFKRRLSVYSYIFWLNFYCLSDIWFYIIYIAFKYVSSVWFLI